MKTTQIVLGIACAAAAGVAIGMLIAPEKGETLRSDIKNSAGDLAKKLGDLFAQGRDHYENIKSQVAQEGEDFKSEINEVYKKSKV
jgi:gas vesicle protein